VPANAKRWTGSSTTRAEGQVARSQSNDDRVVAGENQIDEEHLGEGTE